MMAYLLGYEAEVFGYHFESFSEMWVEWLLDSVFAHVELRNVVADGQAQSFHGVRFLSSLRY